MKRFLPLVTILCGLTACSTAAPPPFPVPGEPLGRELPQDRDACQAQPSLPWCQE